MPDMLSDEAPALELSVQFTLMGGVPMRVITVPLPAHVPFSDERNSRSSACAGCAPSNPAENKIARALVFMASIRFFFED
ncbi:hypothetical protein D3C86_1648830 [compost metagenome]